ncbi:hypothetical protein [Streptomyces mobaraensis]|uniref:hypothetical protein n=1 Tax=Streptomyces mobaraensis TaxID=35621 RepID=UPI0013E0D7D8|nr:hypothetical protein [Streptomyces mobaraensis]
MTAVPVEITPRPHAPELTLAPPRPTNPEPTDILIVSNVETLTAGATPGCNDDNPYT